MNGDNYKVIISLSHHRIAFEYWQRDGEDKLVPMSGQAWPVPLAFYCSSTGIELGDAAVRAVHAGTPNAFDNYFERLPANETYFYGGQRKPLRYLILDGTESVFTEFFKTELLGHHGSLTDNRATMPITMVCESDIKPNERALLLNLFRDSGYNRFRVVEYTGYIECYLRTSLAKEYAYDHVLVAWTEGTDLTLTLFDLTKQDPPQKLKLDGLGKDPRLDYVKKLIWDRISGQNPWLTFADEEAAVTRAARDFLNSSVPLINGTLTLSDGMEYHYSLNRTVIDHLRCPEGDTIRLKLDTFLRDNGNVNRQKILLLLRGMAAGNVFFEQTLGQGFGKIIMSDRHLRSNTMSQLIAEQHIVEPFSPVEEPKATPKIVTVDAPEPAGIDAKEVMRLKREMRGPRAHIAAKYNKGDKAEAGRLYRSLLTEWGEVVPSEVVDELHGWLAGKGISIEELEKAEAPAAPKREMPKPEPKQGKTGINPSGKVAPVPEPEAAKPGANIPASPKPEGKTEGHRLLEKGQFSEAKRFFAGNGDERMKKLCIDLLRDQRDLKAISGQTASALSAVARANNLETLKRIQKNYCKAGLDTAGISALIKKYM